MSPSLLLDRIDSCDNIDMCCLNLPSERLFETASWQDETDNNTTVLDLSMTSNTDAYTISSAKMRINKDLSLESPYPATKDTTKCPTRRLSARKRRLGISGGDEPPAKRISPLLNTPKQRRDDCKKILRMSANKLKLLPDPDSSLLRSVLIRNTVKTLQTEIDKSKSSKQSSYKSYIPKPNTFIEPVRSITPTETISLEHTDSLESDSVCLIDLMADALMTEIRSASKQDLNDEDLGLTDISNPDFCKNTYDKLYSHEIDVVFNSLVSVLDET